MGDPAWVLIGVSVETIIIMACVFYIYCRHCRSEKSCRFHHASFDIVATRWCDYEISLEAAWQRRVYGVTLEKQRNLFVWRLLVFIYMVGIIISSEIEKPHKRNHFLYYTQWNYIWQSIYFGCVAFASGIHMLHRDRQQVLQPWRCFGELVGCLFGISVAGSWFVSFTFWIVLAPAQYNKGHNPFSFFSLNKHAFNTLFVSIELFVNRLSVHENNLPTFVIWGSLFLGYSVVRHMYTGWWPYPILNLNAYALIWYPALELFHVLFFFLALRSSRCKFSQSRRRQFDEHGTDGNGQQQAEAVQLKDKLLGSEEEIAKRVADEKVKVDHRTAEPLAEIGLESSPEESSKAEMEQLDLERAADVEADPLAAVTLSAEVEHSARTEALKATERMELERDAKAEVKG